jgi:hypothetical protein
MVGTLHKVRTVSSGLEVVRRKRKRIFAPWRTRGGMHTKAK